VNVPESWAENSNRIIQRSQNERSKSAQLRTDADNLISQSANDIWNAWNATNSALSRRASEILETKSKLQMHLHKVHRKRLKYMQQDYLDYVKMIWLNY
jgi:tektin-3